MNRFIDYARFHFFISSTVREGTQLLEKVSTFKGWPVQLKFVQGCQEDIFGEHSFPGSFLALEKVLDRAGADKAGLLQLLDLLCIYIWQVMRPGRTHSARRGRCAIFAELREALNRCPAFHACASLIIHVLLVNTLTRRISLQIRCVPQHTVQSLDQLGELYPAGCSRESIDKESELVFLVILLVAGIHLEEAQSEFVTEHVHILLTHLPQLLLDEHRIAIESLEDASANVVWPNIRLISTIVLLEEALNLSNGNPVPPIAIQLREEFLDRNLSDLVAV